MLQRVAVKGFRSLRDLDMEIKPGLNVLVGPNGAGKTNIILFFDFLRAVTSMRLSEAVGSAGGVAQVFAKRGKNSFAEKICVSLRGVVKAGEADYRYEVSLVLSFSQARQDVAFVTQELRIDGVTSEKGKIQSPYAHIKYESSGDGEGQGIKVSRLPDSARGGRNWLKEEIGHLDERGIFSSSCIVNFLLHRDEVASTVAEDFSGRFILNVVPSHVKKPEDSTRAPGIDTDGSGLSATLYAIKKRKHLGTSRMDRLFRRAQPLFMPYWEQVLDLIRIAVPSIEDIDVENDPFDNLLRCRITIGRGNKSAVVPLSALSDGTVKWMSLVARLMTSQEALLLEEPENYLHPLMQREIVRLLRDSIKSTSFMMLSTHSETLLNAVRPDELVVVSYEKGGTQAKRVSNAKDVESEINRTGFGLGYYYLADAVES